jgi:hypothetical protein
MTANLDPQHYRQIRDLVAESRQIAAAYRQPARPRSAAGRPPSAEQVVVLAAAEELVRMQRRLTADAIVAQIEWHKVGPAPPSVTRRQRVLSAVQQLRESGRFRWVLEREVADDA